MYTNEGKLDIVLIYSEHGRNAVRRRQLYGERSPDRYIPSTCTIDNICRKLLATGSWNSTNRHLSKQVTHKASDWCPGVYNEQSRQISRGSGTSR
jgi:hypothetical protein